MSAPVVAMGQCAASVDRLQALGMLTFCYQGWLCLHPIMFELIVKSIYQHLSRFHDERVINFGRGPIIVPKFHKHLSGIC